MKFTPPILAACLAAGFLQAAQPIVIADFESETYGEWKAEGEAFGKGPAHGKLGGQMNVTGFHGKGLVNSFNGGDKATGTLTSPAFKIERKFITFLIGGGGWANETCINLLVDGKVARTASGPNVKPGGSEALAPVAWDVTEFVGRSANIVIVDQRKGGWGHVNVDQIMQADNRGKVDLAAKVEPPPAPAPERIRKVTISGHFLQLPLMQHEDRSKPGLEKLSIEADGKLLRYMNIKLPKPGQQPDFMYSADLREFKGRDVTLRINSHDANALERLVFSDKEIIDPHAYDGPNRPRFHFSPRLGWMNDINGSYFQDGLYHIFYQFNPAAKGMGAGFDMHWGHSVSKDLVHWEEWPVALFPDASGQCYSGTSVMVQQPIPGLIEKAPAPAMFFAATGPFSQHLATTPDGGRTWKRFAGNPVVPNIGSGDRDPKVIWHEASQHYVMVLYVGGKDEGYHFLRSKDLIKWEQTSVLPNWFECPEFIPMKSAITGEDLMMLYGSYRTPKDAPEQISLKSCYQLGRFDGKTFTPITKLRSAHLGPNFYAALIFQNEPKARPIMIGWASGTKFPGEPFNQCASIPLLMQMKAINGEDTLCFEPAEELNALRGKPLMNLSNLSAAEANAKLQGLGKNTPLDVVVRFKTANVNVGIRSLTFDFDATTKTLKRNGQATVIHPGASLDARFLIDHGIIESFWNGGEAAYSVASLASEVGPAFAVEGDATIEELTVYPMANIWPRHQSEDVVIFEDGKEMPLSAGLEFHHGSWKFGDGAMIGEQVPTEKHLATIKGLVPFDHLKIEWKMKFMQPKENFLFVTWPADSGAHAMDFTFNPDNGQFAIVRPKTKDKDSAVLAKGQSPKLGDEWHDIVCIHDGPHFTVTIDGATLTGSDESFARPMGPFYLNGGGFDGAKFMVKDLRVTALK